MSEQTPTLATNGKKAALRILEKLRGPAIVLLRKAGAKFQTADAQPVVKIRTDRGQTRDSSPTPGARVLTLGTGGYQLSICIDDDDSALAVPLESDHENFYKTGKVSDPATPRVHDMGLAAVLPFRWLGEKVAALSGELYLGHKDKKFHMRFNRDQLLIEIETPAGQGRMNFGAGATLGAGRVTDPVGATGAFKSWAVGVDAALVAAMSANGTPFPLDDKIGTITSGSGDVFIR